MSISCLAAGFESRTADLTKKVAEAEATLQAERAALTAERERVHKSAQALKAAIYLASGRDMELEQEVQARLRAKTKLELPRQPLPSPRRRRCRMLLQLGPRL